MTFNNGSVKIEIEDTYAEAFEGIFTRLIITAKDKVRLKKASYNSTALPSAVINRTEGGVEAWLDKSETPDGRLGSIVQFWGVYRADKSEKALDRFYTELSYRIRQGILVVPTTAVFNAYESKKKIDTMDRVGHCGDGYESEDDYEGRHIIKIPLMMGDFIIERYIGYGLGVMGGNIWLMCETEDVALDAGEKAVEAINKIEGVITPFDICSAGSKLDTKYPNIGPTTNHPYCPSLKRKLSNSKVPRSVSSIPEIVINGITLSAVKNSMKAAILSVQDVTGLRRISAGNYGGALGKYKIFLREMFT